MRWAGLVLVAALLGLAAFAFFGQGSALADGRLPDLVWLLMALILVGGGAAAAARRRSPGSRTPGVWLSLLIWGALIGLIVLVYDGAAFWSAIGALFR